MSLEVINLNLIKKNIIQSSLSFGHTPPEILVVTKGQNQERIRPILDSGHRLFGENRINSAKEKWESLRKAYPDINLHLIGPLQTNKVKEALNVFDVIETIDREKLVQAILRLFPSAKRSVRFRIQVNTGEEPQKSGIEPKKLVTLIEFCRKHGLLIEGLMCIPPANEDPAPHFALLKKLANRHKFKHISMGMSQDYHVAAMLGATEVRIGSAIFSD